MKIGAIDFDRELEILKSIRSRFDKDELELRVDANGAFSEKDVREKLEKLSKYDLHSIEQPIKPGQRNLLSELCKSSPVPIALDEELISLIDEKERIQMLRHPPITTILRQILYQLQALKRRAQPRFSYRIHPLHHGDRRRVLRNRLGTVRPLLKQIGRRSRLRPPLLFPFLIGLVAGGFSSPFSYAYCIFPLT